MDIVIGLIGAKAAGKTTAFNAIKAMVDVQEITLASKLKDVSASVFNIPREHFDSHEFKEKEFENLVYVTGDAVKEIFFQYGLDVDYGKFVRPHIGKVLVSPRQVAQYVGTEVLRSYMPDIHCWWAAKAVNKRVGVVTDMRFPNEYDYFKKNYKEFHPIYIHNMSAEIMAGKDTHASEAYLKDLAAMAIHKVQNNGTIQEFERSIEFVVRTIV